MGAIAHVAAMARFLAAFVAPVALGLLLRLFNSQLDNSAGFVFGVGGLLWGGWLVRRIFGDTTPKD